MMSIFRADTFRYIEIHYGICGEFGWVGFQIHYGICGEFGWVGFQIHYGICGEFGWVGFLVVCSLYKINPDPRKISCGRKKVAQMPL